MGLYRVGQRWCLVVRHGWLSGEWSRHSWHPRLWSQAQWRCIQSRSWQGLRLWSRSREVRMGWLRNDQGSLCSWSVLYSKSIVNDILIEQLWQVRGSNYCYMIIDAHIPFLESNQAVTGSQLASQLFIFAFLFQRLAQVVAFNHWQEKIIIFKRVKHILN